MAGGLHHRPADVTVADLGNRSLATLLVGALLGGDEADEAHHLFGALEAMKVADFARQPDDGQGVDPVQVVQLGYPIASHSRHATGRASDPVACLHGHGPRSRSASSLRSGTQIASSNPPASSLASRRSVIDVALRPVADQPRRDDRARATRGRRDGTTDARAQRALQRARPLRARLPERAPKGLRPGISVRLLPADLTQRVKPARVVPSCV